MREAANQLSNKLSHAQHLDEVTWTTKNWHGLQMQRLSVVLHAAVTWQTVNELACGPRENREEKRGCCREQRKGKKTGWTVLGVRPLWQDNE